MGEPSEEKTQNIGRKSITSTIKQKTCKEMDEKLGRTPSLEEVFFLPQLANAR
jgi:hypothetical protein